MSRNSDKPGWVRVKDSIPFLGKGVDDIVTAIRAVLKENPYTQKLTLEIGKPILFEKMVPKDKAPDQATVSVYDQIKAKPMTEYVIEEESRSRPAFAHLWEMSQIIHNEGLSLSHLLLGNRFLFQQWLRVQIPITNLAFFGVPVQVDTAIEEDVFVLCGSDDEGELQFSLKAVIP